MYDKRYAIRDQLSKIGRITYPMPRYARKFILVFFALLVAGSTSAAIPTPIGYVNDFTGILDSSTKTKLEQTLASFEIKTGDEVAVAIVKSLEGRTVEDYAVDLYKTWGIGKKGKDNGILILVSPSEGQMRIEVGYGLEGVINDAMAGRIIREKMIPAFKEGRYDVGIWNGTMTVLEIVAKDAGIQLNPDSDKQLLYEQSPKTKKGPLHTIGSILLFILLVYLFIRHPWLFLLFMGSGGGGGSRSGGFGGGFGGFGGGLSGGGGASGRW